ncbi:MAG: chromosome partitioning protein ParB [Candidatus Portnoybacteria bacterium CG10_big_fil_rev_8_21_14_0_10_36_7]|uniref:Chromosome partitioning protein ParB n=1 Tax=Candidatus Portnoybacteria bacterium CG10_big_fil_rev_8_21_14_0_10_36_7 TaxID=1974812 RepID=A0A2M8KE65_9BACT|nr:MAG: chromosome partitioning protein ParB [Candidatus Portnoybacteria bacterium CG10_big_fil_rev_8_21_14_0_10_36_7]
MQNKNLGKGLQSLIPQKVNSTAGNNAYPKISQPLRHGGSQNHKESVFNIETNNIVPNSHQPRYYFDPEKLKDLASSIKEHGILQPLILTKISGVAVGQPVQYQLIAGQRRWEAAKMLKLPHVPAIVRDSSTQQRLEIALVENIQRADLNPMEEATAYKSLQEEFGLSHQQIAQKVGKSREVVSNAIRLLGLPDEIKDAIRKGRISEGHGRVLAGIKNQRQQKELFEEVLTGSLSVRQIEQKARIIQPQQARPRKVSSLSPFIKKIQQDVGKFFGAKVSVAGNKDSGKISVSYDSSDELQKILGKLK